MVEVAKFPLPNNIQIELVEGCNRMCRFCGIHGIWANPEHRKINFMDTDFAAYVAKSLREWGFNKKRVEFAMHGEPTLHKDLVKIIGIFREELPKAQLQITTNGKLLALRGPDYVKHLFEAGLNVLIVDLYEDKEDIILACKNSGVKVCHYYEEHNFNPYYYHNSTDQTILLMDDLGAKTGSRVTRAIINHAGNANKDNLREFGIEPLRVPLKKQCSRPSREITIHWDGTVPFCCLDWKHEFIAGKLSNTNTFDEIWNSEVFMAVRVAMKAKQRMFRPCYRCDYPGGFRLGLLANPTLDITPIKAICTVIDHLKTVRCFNHPATTDPIAWEPAVPHSSFFKTRG